MTPTLSQAAYERRLANNRAWKERNKARLRVYGIEYNKTRNKEVKRAQNRKSAKAHNWYPDYERKRDPIKVAARRAIRDRIYRGKLKRLPCEVCSEPKSHAHHGDYSKPLEVKWLCAKHHKELHERLENATH